jgi:hypothetical protein
MTTNNATGLISEEKVLKDVYSVNYVTPDRGH